MVIVESDGLVAVDSMKNDTDMISVVKAQKTAKKNTPMRNERNNKKNRSKPFQKPCISFKTVIEPFEMSIIM